MQRNDVEQLFALIRKLKNDGMSIIYISHFLEEVREIADSFTVLRDGRSVGTVKVADTSVGQLIQYMVGRTIDQQFPKVTAERGGEVLGGYGYAEREEFEKNRGELETSTDESEHKDKKATRT